MPLPERLTETIALHLRDKIRAGIDDGAGTGIDGTSPGGDATFAADSFAEEALCTKLAELDLNVAVYSEDRGLNTFGAGEPEGILIVDPIDGTRPFNAGLPVSTVSVALAEYKDRPAFEDIREACLAELATERVYFAEGNEPPEIVENGRRVRPLPYANTDLAKTSFAFELAGRPSMCVMRLLGEWIDSASLKGGCFTLASSAYSIAKVVTGSLGAFVDVGGWLLDACMVEEEEAMGLYPYDIAAAWLIARNAGCNITDLYGKPLIDVVLTESTPDNILSCVVTANLDLHKNILAHLKEKAEKVLAEEMGA